MKLQEIINGIKPRFYQHGGSSFGLTESQSEAHVDLTFSAALQFLQGLMMAGKLAELKSLVSAGPQALRTSSYKAELVDKCAQSYYGLDWPIDRKRELAESVLVFLLQELQLEFQRGGYSPDAAGVMKFMGMDSGLLGKMGGLFGTWL